MTQTKETTVTAQTQTLELPDVDLTYDVRGPIPDRPTAARCSCAA